MLPDNGARILISSSCTVVGPLQCPLIHADLAIAIIVVILVLSAYFVCCSCIIRNYALYYLLFIFFGMCYLMLTWVFVALVIASSIYMYVFYQRQERQDSTTMCRYIEAPGATVVAGYLFIALLCLSTTVSCCYISKQKRNHNVPVCHCRVRTDV